MRTAIVTQNERFVQQHSCVDVHSALLIGDLECITKRWRLALKPILRVKSRGYSFASKHVGAGVLCKRSLALCTNHDRHLARLAVAAVDGSSTGLNYATNPPDCRSPLRLLEVFTSAPPKASNFFVVCERVSIISLL